MLLLSQEQRDQIQSDMKWTEDEVLDFLATEKEKNNKPFKRSVKDKKFLNQMNFTQILATTTGKARMVEFVDDEIEVDKFNEVSD